MLILYCIFIILSIKLLKFILKNSYISRAENITYLNIAIKIIKFAQLKKTF